MDRESMKKLRLDRRLIRRRGWIRPNELEKELSRLPDVSDKVAPIEEDAPGANEADAPPDLDSEAPPSIQ